MIEYRYYDRDALISRRLDAPKRRGTFGTVVYTYAIQYNQFPGKLYHPVNTFAEALYWLNHYRSRADFYQVYFVPSPDQYELASEPEDSNLEEGVNDGGAGGAGNGDGDNGDAGSGDGDNGDAGNGDGESDNEDGTGENDDDTENPG